MMEGPCADSEEKHEPVSDTNTAAIESLKALDPDRPIREADISLCGAHVRFWGWSQPVNATPTVNRKDRLRVLISEK
jgi:hypothetical protein